MLKVILGNLIIRGADYWAIKNRMDGVMDYLVLRLLTNRSLDIRSVKPMDMVVLYFYIHVCLFI